MHYINQIVLGAILLIGLNVLSSSAMDEWESWSLEELNRQMSPSQWNPSKTPKQVIDEYIRVSIQETKNSLETVPHQQNVSYGTKVTQKYDLYGTDLAEESPIFIFLHGGYWQEGSKDISGGYGTINHQNGIRTVVVGYTLAPDVKIQEIEDEVIQALTAINIRFPKAQIIISGHSAGGQLAAHVLHQPSKPLDGQFYNQLVGLVLISGVYDMRPLVKTYVNDALKMTNQDAESLSALRSSVINPNLKPELNLMLIVGEMDSPEFQRQTHEYYEKLKKTFPKTNYWKSQSDDHFTIVQNMALPSTPCGQRVQDFLKTCKLTGNEQDTRGGGPSRHRDVPTIFLLISLLFIWTISI